MNSMKDKPGQVVERVFERFIHAYNNKTPSLSAKYEMVYLAGKDIIFERTRKGYMAAAIYDDLTITVGLIKEMPNSDSIVVGYTEKYNLIECFNEN